MHIGINTLSVIPGATGGGETYLSGLVRALSALDTANRYTLFVGPENQNHFRVANPNFERLSVGFSQRRKVRRVLWEHFELPRLAAKRGVEVLFCPGNVAPKNVRCAVVLGIQSLLYHLAPSDVSAWRRLYFNRVVPSSARRAERIIAVSEDARKSLLQIVEVPPDKICVVHEGVDPNFTRPPSNDVTHNLRVAGLSPGYILFVSTLKPYKNPHTLIIAASVLKESHALTPAIVFVGRDPANLQPELSGLAQRAGVGGQLHFLGAVPHERLPSLYAAAAVFVYPSAIETFGLPVLEAMACGTPVVGSNRAAIPEVMGDAGLCVDPDNTPALAEAIYKVLSDAALRDSLREKGFERVKLFTWERAARETLKVFEEAYAIWKENRAKEATAKAERKTRITAGKTTSKETP